MGPARTAAPGKSSPAPKVLGIRIAEGLLLLSAVVLGALYKADVPVVLIGAAFAGIAVLDLAGFCQGTQHLKLGLSLLTVAGFCSALWVYGRNVVTISHFILSDIVIVCLLFWFFSTHLPEKGAGRKTMSATVCCVTGSCCSFCIALFFAFVLYGWLHLPWIFCMIVSLAVLLFFMTFVILLSVYADEA